MNKLFFLFGYLISLKKQTQKRNTTEYKYLKKYKVSTKHKQNTSKDKLQNTT